MVRRHPPAVDAGIFRLFPPTFALAHSSLSMSLIDFAQFCTLYPCPALVVTAAGEPAPSNSPSDALHSNALVFYTSLRVTRCIALFRWPDYSLANSLIHSFPQCSEILTTFLSASAYPNDPKYGLCNSATKQRRKNVFYKTFTIVDVTVIEGILNAPTWLEDHCLRFNELS